MVGFCEGCNPPVLGWAHETTNLVGFIADSSIRLGSVGCLQGPATCLLLLHLGSHRVLVITNLVFVKAVTHPFSVGPTRLQILFNGGSLLLQHDKKRWMEVLLSRHENGHPAILSGVYGEEKPGREPHKNSCAASFVTYYRTGHPFKFVTELIQI